MTSLASFSWRFCWLWVHSRPYSCVFNPFHVTDLFLYRLKTYKNLWFSDVLRGFRKRTVPWKRLMSHVQKYLLTLLYKLHFSSFSCTCNKFVLILVTSNHSVPIPPSIFILLVFCSSFSSSFKNSVKQNFWIFLGGNYKFKVKKPKTRSKICSKLTTKTTERCQWRLSGDLTVNSEHISQLFLVFLLLTLT